MAYISLPFVYVLISANLPLCCQKSIPSTQCSLVFPFPYKAISFTRSDPSYHFSLSLPAIGGTAVLIHLCSKCGDVKLKTYSPKEVGRMHLKCPRQSIENEYHPSKAFRIYTKSCRGDSAMTRAAFIDNYTEEGDVLKT